MKITKPRILPKVKHTIPKLRVVLDFETFIDKKEKYSLKAKGVGTSDYIRDPRFKAHGASVKIGNRKPRWIPHHLLETTLGKIPWDRVLLICHNTAFDAAILHWHYGHKPAFYADTLSMCRAILNHKIPADLGTAAETLGVAQKMQTDIVDRCSGIRDLPPDLDKEMGEYAIDDVIATAEIFDKLAPDYPEDEMELIHLSIKAFAEPVIVINRNKVLAEYNKEKAEEERVLRKVKRILKVKTDEEAIKILGSSDQLEAVFLGLGIKPPMKWSVKQKKEIPAFAKTDTGMIEFAKHEDHRVRALVQARLNVKSNIALERAEKLLARQPHGALPIMLNYCRAHTFRWSGGDLINPQNFPTRSGAVGLRHALEAPRGFVFAIVDSSQIEARITAWLAGQQDILDAFAQGKDPYKIMASKIFGKPVSKITAIERFVGKTAVLALGFGQGWESFQDTLASGRAGKVLVLEDAICRKAVNVYRATNYFIVNLWKEFDIIIRSILALPEDAPKQWLPFPGDTELLMFTNQKVWMPNGLYLDFPELSAGGRGYRYKQDYKWVNLYGGKLTENVVQSLARIVVGMQMLHIAERYRIVTMAHDEVVYLTPTKERKEALGFGLEVFRTLPAPWCEGLVLDAEGTTSKRYIKP